MLTSGLSEDSFASCHTHALVAYNSLLHSIAQPICIQGNERWALTVLILDQNIARQTGFALACLKTAQLQPTMEEAAQQCASCGHSQQGYCRILHQRHVWLYALARMAVGVTWGLHLRLATQTACCHACLMLTSPVLTIGSCLLT